MSARTTTRTATRPSAKSAVKSGITRAPAKCATKPSAKKKTVKASASLRASDPLARVQRAIERELEKIEAIVGTDGPQEGERTARTLAVLARTLKDVTQISAAATSRKKALKTAKARAQPDGHDDDRVPRDIEQFRRELAQRLDALVAGATAEDSQGD